MYYLAIYLHQLCKEKLCLYRWDFLKETNGIPLSIHCYVSPWYGCNNEDIINFTAFPLCKRDILYFLFSYSLSKVPAGKKNILISSIINATSVCICLHLFASVCRQTINNWMMEICLWIDTMCSWAGQWLCKYEFSLTVMGFFAFQSGHFRYPSIYTKFTQKEINT